MITQQHERIIPNQTQLLVQLKELHTTIRDMVVASCEQSAIDELSCVVAEEQNSDTIYAIDRISEELLLDFFSREIAPFTPLVLIAEGLSRGEIVLPEGTAPADALIRVIVDPIDGTRGLMYQKRSAWILTGVAPNYGDATSLRHIQLALQTEIPLVKQHMSDMLWACAGLPPHAERYNRVTGDTLPIYLHPSRATTIAHGFAMISRFFPGGREELAAIDDAVVQAILGQPQRGKAHCFEDQYICTAGQLYELIAGHDRFVADIRPLLEQWLTTRGNVPGICCHPYDMASMLIAQQYGIIITNNAGEPLDAPLNTTHDIAWVGYANHAIRQQVEPPFHTILQHRGLSSKT